MKCRYSVGRLVSCRVTFVCAISAWVTVHAFLHGANISISVGVFPLPLRQSGIVAKIAHTHSLFAVHRRPTDAFGSGGFCCCPPSRRSLAIIRERSSSTKLVLVCQRVVATSDRRHFHSFPSLSNLDDKCRHRLRCGRPPRAIVSLFPLARSA